MSGKKPIWKVIPDAATHRVLIIVLLILILIITVKLAS